MTESAKCLFGEAAKQYPHCSELWLWAVLSLDNVRNAPFSPVHDSRSIMQFGLFAAILCFTASAEFQLIRGGAHGPERSFGRSAAIGRKEPLFQVFHFAANVGDQGTFKTFSKVWAWTGVLMASSQEGCACSKNRFC